MPAEISALRGKPVVMVFGMSFHPHQGRYLRVRNQAKSLARAGCRVTLIAWDRECQLPKREAIEGFQVERIHLAAGKQKGPRNALRVLIYNCMLFGRLWRHRADVVHCFNLESAPAAWLAARLRGRKFVLDLCEPEYYAMWPRRYAPFLWLVNAVERFVARHSQWLFVHNSYQVGKFRAAGVRRLTQIGSYPSADLILDDVPAHKRAAHSPVVIGRFGSIYEDNGIEEMLAAFRLLLERGHEVRLLLGGKVFDSYRPTFEKLMRGVGENVEVLGPFDPRQLPELYARTDIALVLARRTRWFRHITPTKFFEALANATPVVASDIGELREFVESSGCGFIVDETDPAAVCDALEKLVTDHKLRLRMARAGLELVRSRCSWPRMEPRLLKAYANLLNPESGGEN